MIDELKQQLGDIGADDPIKAAVVDEAARRARKYGGALGTATQKCRRLLRLGADGGRVQLFRLGVPAAPEEGIHRAAAQEGPARDGRGKGALLNSLRTEPGRVLGAVRQLAGRRGRGAPDAGPGRPTCSSPTSSRTTRRSTNCVRRASRSMRRSPKCCAVEEVAPDQEPFWLRWVRDRSNPGGRPVRLSHALRIVRRTHRRDRRRGGVPAKEREYTELLTKGQPRTRIASAPRHGRGIRPGAAEGVERVAGRVRVSRACAKCRGGDTPNTVELTGAATQARHGLTMSAASVIQHAGRFGHGASARMPASLVALVSYRQTVAAARGRAGHLDAGATFASSSIRRRACRCSSTGPPACPITWRGWSGAHDDSSAGDFVVLRFSGKAQVAYPGLRRQPFFKIVAGVPGDPILGADRNVFVGGNYVGFAKLRTFDGRALNPVERSVVPAGHYYVRGTSPDSFDSRYQEAGFVARAEVIGKVIPWF